MWYHSLAILLPLPRRYAREIKDMSSRGDYEIPTGGHNEGDGRVVRRCPVPHGTGASN